MGNLTEWDGLIALDDLAPRGVQAHDDTPPAASRNVHADGSATGERPAITVDEIDSWARHARGANGLGGVETRAPASSAGPASYELHRAARSQRALTLGRIIARAMRTAGAIARQAYARYRQRREAIALTDTLRQLDDRTLRDLGFDRSEIRSVAAEFTGEAERTRMRFLMVSYNPRG